MTQATADPLAVFELPRETAGRTGAESPDASRRASLPEPLLVKNVLWNCRLRWLVVGLFVAYEGASLLPEVWRRLGLEPNTGWPILTAAILTAGNVVFLGHAQVLRRSGATHGAQANLWGQIILDLLVLTMVVHFAGSLATHVAFVYLFHIVLACIFFPGPHSLVVTLMACMLYVGCVAAEATGLVATGGIYGATSIRQHLDQMPVATLMDVGSALAIWLTVWYLASHLSAMVRQRDRELAQANRRLLVVQQDKDKHMLRTTHELKAPFAAIEANTQLLLKGYCGELTPDARDVLDRISARCRRLSTEIQEMLQLANLRSVDEDELHWVELDLGETLQWCLGQVRALAEERSVAFDTEIEPARTVGVEDHAKMLLGNLLSNAVLYSHPGSTVHVRCRQDHRYAAVVTIQDHGIGVPADKLPHIFDEYYRTDEAVRHNKGSTGLGLAIVRHVAEAHGVGVRVESRPGMGTTFVLQFTSNDRQRARIDKKGDA